MQESSSNLPPSVLNFSPFAHEISSVEAPKGGKFEEDSCINICLQSRPVSPNVVCPSVRDNVENSDWVTK